MLTIKTGIERLPAGLHRPRHQHGAAYATLILEGSYRQIGYAGRLEVVSGDLLLQPTLDCHSDQMTSDGVTVLRLPMTRKVTFGGVYRGHDLDAIRRVAESDSREASQMIESIIATSSLARPRTADWEDLLGEMLRTDQRLQIRDFAARINRSREAVSRGFKRAYGVSPAAFRGEIRARAAWLKITGTSEVLSDIAVTTGYSDQPHMTRAVKALTGGTPLFWRQRIGPRSR